LVKEARLETEKQVRDEAERVHTFHSPVSMRKHQFYFLHHSRLSICSGGWSRECYSERGCGCFFNLWRRRPFSLIVNANTKGAEYRCHSQNWTTSCNNFKEQKPLSSPERRGTKFVGLPQEGFPFPHSIIYPQCRRYSSFDLLFVVRSVGIYQPQTVFKIQNEVPCTKPV